MLTLSITGTTGFSVRVCLVIDDYLPNSTKIGAKMMHELACKLLSEGHKVTVISPCVLLANAKEVVKFEDVSVWKFRTGKIKNTCRVQRTINETLLSLRAWLALRKQILEEKHDLIVYYSPSIFWGPLIVFLKFCWNARSYLVLRDFFPQWVIDNGLLSKYSPIAAYFRFFEWLNYRAADVIGVQSQENKKAFARISNILRPIEVLYNWSSLDTLKTTSGRYRQQLGLQNKVVFFYGGNIGVAQDMMNVVRLAKGLLNDGKAHFLLVGDGDEAPLIAELIDKGALTNLTLLPAVTQLEYFEILNEFDVGLFSLHRDHTAHNFPGKLLGYMAHAKPILGSVNTGNDVKEVIVQAGAGLVATNGNDKEFLANAMLLLHDRSLRKSMGTASRHLLENQFSVDRAVAQVLAVVD